MHRVLAQIVDTNGLERAAPDMQRDAGDRDAHGLDGLEEIVAEVKSGGRRRDRAVVGREHGLVALAIIDGVCLRWMRRSVHRMTRRRHACARCTAAAACVHGVP